MSIIAQWSLIIGFVFTAAALGQGPLKKLPLSMTAIYLGVGVLVGPWFLDLLQLDLTEQTKLLEVLAEIGVLVSLLTAGLRLSPDWLNYLKTPVPLATATMTLTIAMLAALGYFAIGLPLGAAVLLGAVLAPTDPVLAGEVQVMHKHDKDRLRFSLTGEAGLNDGAAFPFIMLGLGLLGLHELGDWGWRWFAIDLLYAVAAGIASGWLCGYLTSKLTLWVKQQPNALVSSEELLTLGLIGLSYGVAMAIGSYGFLAVFFAGVAVRRYTDRKSDPQGEDDAQSEEKQSEAKQSEAKQSEATQQQESKEESQRQDADELFGKVVGINQQLGDILEVGLVVIIGVLLSTHWTLLQDWWIAVTLFAVIRPIATYRALAWHQVTPVQRRLIAFFGIRGIGSIYYLAYAIGKGMDSEVADRLSGIVLTTIAISLLLHSNTASTLLAMYRKRPESDS